MHTQMVHSEAVHDCPAVNDFASDYGLTATNKGEIILAEAAAEAEAAAAAAAEEKVHTYAVS